MINSCQTRMGEREDGKVRKAGSQNRAAREFGCVGEWGGRVRAEKGHKPRSPELEGGNHFPSRCLLCFRPNHIMLYKARRQEGCRGVCGCLAVLACCHGGLCRVLLCCVVRLCRSSGRLEACFRNQTQKGKGMPLSGPCKPVKPRRVISALRLDRENVAASFLELGKG